MPERKTLLYINCVYIVPILFSFSLIGLLTWVGITNNNAADGFIFALVGFIGMSSILLVYVYIKEICTLVYIKQTVIPLAENRITTFRSY